MKIKKINNFFLSITKKKRVGIEKYEQNVQIVKFT